MGAKLTVSTLQRQVYARLEEALLVTDPPDLEGVLAVRELDEMTLVEDAGGRRYGIKVELLDPPTYNKVVLATMFGGREVQLRRLPQITDDELNLVEIVGENDRTAWTITESGEVIRNSQIVSFRIGDRRAI
jgi:hypothetical protein